MALAMFLFFRPKGAGRGFTGLGKSRAKDFKALTANETRLTFDDIAGVDEAIVHLKRISRWRKFRWLYELFGAKTPRGYLLKGPPGTGKTLSVTILAHQTDADVHVCSGSDFDEMLVGVGSSRVRDLFERAHKQHQETGRDQYIIIDEIDAVAGKRNPLGNTGTEPTLNAMLVQLDGVLKNKGIIVFGITNRDDMLDEAIKRPGRLEYHIKFDNPDVGGRESIAKIYARNKPMARDANPAWVARQTPGFSGAKIELLYNHAAILAAERVNPPEAGLHALTPDMTITRDDVLSAIDFVLHGDELTGKQSRVSEEEEENTTVHETAHALVADSLKQWATPVRKATIMRRSEALGFVAFLEEQDRTGWQKQQLYAHIIVYMAGAQGRNTT